MYSLKEIAEITGATFVGNTNYKVEFFLNDSRSLQAAENTLFIGLKTNRNNGHFFIPDLFKKGVRSFLIQENEFDPSDLITKGGSFLLAAQPLQALQKLAIFHRQQFKIPIIGITGSNGKTIVKEWLYQLLKDDFSICRSPKSYNSQIGVPLSVLNLNRQHTLGIFEAGISLPGEMELLSEIIQPTIGVLTSLGSAHDEGFESRTEKRLEKLKLLLKAEKIVVNGLEKNEVPSEIISRSLVVSESLTADLLISFDEGVLKLKSNSASYAFKIPFVDKASYLNASTCVAVMMQLGIKEQIIAERLLMLQPVALRLELKNGINNSLIINDYYNSDLDSIKIALNYLQQQNRRAKKIVVISDIEQSGLTTMGLYRQLSELLTFNKIDLIVGIGKDISNHRSLFKLGSLFFADTQSFVSQFRTINYQFSESTVLLKGARSFGFEEISRLMQLKSHDTVFEVNLNKLIDNVNYYRSLLAPEVQLMCMVKAMGYGSGSTEIARTLQHIGANYLAVAYADEGVELRQSQVNLPIMVMSPEDDALVDIINYQLEPELYSFKVLHAFVKTLDTLGITEPYPVHLKIDTGMHRLGFEKQDLEALLAALDKYKQLKVKSVFSHMVGSDNEALNEFTNNQISLFEEMSSAIEKSVGHSVLKHLCNSAGISRFKNAHYNMVRLGIGMYGISSSSEEQKRLENVGILKTKISQIKQVKKGDTVGYNRNGKIDKDAAIATIPIGYADGFSRLLGNGKHGVFVNNVFCKTVGNICMDMSMIDVTQIACNEGDEVIIFEDAAQINLMAAALNTISYEVLTGVSSRVKRVYVQE
jgi:alanine racemase